MQYFVILNHPDYGHYFPLVDDEGKLRLFDSEDAAEKAGNECFMGMEYGMVVYELNKGVHC